MGRGIKKLGEDKFVEWSGCCDAPSSYVFSYKSGIEEEDIEKERMDRANANGHSYTDREPDFSCAAFNRAGPNEIRLSIQEMIERYSSEDEQKEFDEKFKSSSMFKLRDAIRWSFDITLPISMNKMFDEVFKDASDIKMIADKFNSFADCHDSLPGCSGCAFAYPTEAFLVLLSSIFNNCDDADIDWTCDLVEKHWSKGPENGKYPDLKIVNDMIVIFNDFYRQDSEFPATAKTRAELPLRTLERDVRLLNGIYSNSKEILRK
jgi:hypothetical protein